MSLLNNYVPGTPVHWPLDDDDAEEEQYQGCGFQNLGHPTAYTADADKDIDESDDELEDDSDCEFVPLIVGKNDEVNELHDDYDDPIVEANDPNDDVGKPLSMKVRSWVSWIMLVLGTSMLAFLSIMPAEEPLQGKAITPTDNPPQGNVVERVGASFLQLFLSVGISSLKPDGCDEGLYVCDYDKIDEVYVTRLPQDLGHGESTPVEIPFGRAKRDTGESEKSDYDQFTCKDGILVRKYNRRYFSHTCNFEEKPLSSQAENLNGGILAAAAKLMEAEGKLMAAELEKIQVSEERDRKKKSYNKDIKQRYNTAIHKQFIKQSINDFKAEKHKAEEK